MNGGVVALATDTLFKRYSTLLMMLPGAVTLAANAIVAGAVKVALVKGAVIDTVGGAAAVAVTSARPFPPPKDSPAN